MLSIVNKKKGGNIVSSKTNDLTNLGLFSYPGTSETGCVVLDL